MQRLHQNLLVRFSIASFVVIIVMAVATAILLTTTLDRNIEYLQDHGAAMMAGKMIKPTDPFSIPSLTRNVHNLQATTVAALGVGFATLYFTLFGIVWGGWRTINSQRKQLESVNTELAKGVEDLTKANEQLVFEATERQQAEVQIKASLQEKEVLLREIHHRVKNNLQVIASLLNLQSRSITDDQVLEPLRESQNRIESMALIHQKLYDSNNLMVVDFAEYSRSLAAELFSTYGVGQAVTLEVDSDAGASLTINSAIPCGLIINELVSNSLKYAFSGAQAGSIRIGLHQVEKDKLVLMVADNGAGIPEEVDFRNTESLGLRLVNILSGQLEGTLELERNGGTKFKLTFASASNTRSK